MHCPPLSSLAAFGFLIVHLTLVRRLQLYMLRPLFPGSSESDMINKVRVVKISVGLFQVCSSPVPLLNSRPSGLPSARHPDHGDLAGGIQGWWHWVMWKGGKCRRQYEEMTSFICLCLLL